MAAAIERRATCDESGEWRAMRYEEMFPNSDPDDMRRPEVDIRPVSHPRLRRPTSAFARKMAANPETSSNPRWHGDNVVRFDLDMPKRTTTDHPLQESADGTSPQRRVTRPALTPLG